MDYIMESNLFSSVISLFENYGWYILIAAVVFVYIYNAFLKSHIEEYRRYRFEKEYAAKYHKNPDLFAKHINAQQKWAEKLQEQYKKDSEQYLQKQKEKEEKKRQELLATSIDGYKLGNGKSEQDDNKKSTLRNDYNPLMGAGSSSSYRPPRRSPCGGGGCGR